MDAASALADLTEISSQVEAAVVLGRDGSVAASTYDDPAASERLATAGAELREAANRLRQREGGGVTRLEAALREGSLFVVDEGPSRIVATTTPRPASPLVFHDLSACLRSIGDGAGDA